jgi:signal peptidase II
VISRTKREALLLAVLLGLDQGTKAWVRLALPLGARWEPWGGAARIVHAENPGAVFGLLGSSELRGLFFSIVTLVAFVVVLATWRRAGPEEPLLRGAMLCLAAGALGNFLDRLMYRQVCDWIDLAGPGPLGVLFRAVFGSDRWPTFNLADLWASSGAILVLAHARWELWPVLLRPSGSPRAGD